MKNNHYLIVIILLASFMILGYECGSTDPAPPPEAEPDSTLSNATFNGTWIYLDFTYHGVQYPLEDSLYIEPDTEWASMTFQDYEDTTRTDKWFYSEHSELWTEHEEDGKLDTLYGGLFLSEWTGIDWEAIAGYNWSVHGDTLILTDYYDSDRFFRLIKASAWPGWEPDLKDVGYNGDWVFVNYIAHGTSYPLEEYLYNSTATSWAVMEFRNYEDDTWTDTWNYSEHNSVVGFIEGDDGELIDDGLLRCMLNDGGASVPYWQFTWSLEAGDTLHLYDFLDANIYYQLIPRANFEEPGPPMKDIQYNGNWIFEEYIYNGISYPLEDSLYTSPDAEWAGLNLSDFLHDSMQDTWLYNENNLGSGNVYSLSGNMTAGLILLLEWYDAGPDEWVEWNHFSWSVPGGQEKLYLYVGGNTNNYYVLVPE